MSLNIGGSEDAFFRYKMPDIMTKIEGRGNGIKTVLPNIADVALSLKRDPKYPTKYFAIELGALSQWDAERNVGIVNGAHDKSVIAKLLADFIDRYVLCPKCKLPETDLRIKSGMINQKCAACGFRGPSDNAHKLAKYIVNNPPPKSSKKDKDESSSGKKGSKSGSKKGSKKDKDKKDKKEKQKSKEDPEGEEEEEEEGEAKSNGSGSGDADAPANGEEEEGEIDFEVSEDMIKATEQTHLSDIVNPVDEMRTALTGVTGTAQQIEALNTLQAERGFSNEERLQYVVKALVSDSMLTQIKEILPLLKMITTSDSAGQAQIIALIEERCEAFPVNNETVSKTLELLYDEDVLEEDAILLWADKGVSQLYALADLGPAEQTRKAATTFIEWLRTADEEDSE